MEQILKLKAEVYDLIGAKEQRVAEISKIDAMIKERVEEINSLSSSLETPKET